MGGNPHVNILSHFKFDHIYIHDRWGDLPQGGFGTPLYKPYRYSVCAALQVVFLHCFGLKTGIHFAHFGLELGMVFGKLQSV